MELTGLRQLVSDTEVQCEVVRAWPKLRYSYEVGVTRSISGIGSANGSFAGVFTGVSSVCASGLALRLPIVIGTLQLRPG
jgi:hypothetical protein